MKGEIDMKRYFKETTMEFIKDFYRQEGKLNHRMEMIIEDANRSSFCM